MTEDEIAMEQVKFERETKEIKAEFSRLLLRLQRSLEEQLCKVDDVVNLLINLEDNDWMKRCSSIAEVFTRANRFCSFYDTKALKLLIEELGTEKDKGNYDHYKRRFQRFCSKRVFLFPDGKSSREVEMLAIEMDKHMEKLPVDQKRELQFEMGRVFKGRSQVVMLSKQSSTDSTTSQTSTNRPVATNPTAKNASSSSSIPIGGTVHVNEAVRNVGETSATTPEESSDFNQTTNLNADSVQSYTNKLSSKASHISSKTASTESTNMTTSIVYINGSSVPDEASSLFTPSEARTRTKLSSISSYTEVRN